MDEGLREAANRGRDGFPLEERFAAGPADIPDPFGSTRELADPAHDVVHVDLGEFASLHGVHGVAPLAAEIAGVEADEHGRQSDERALSLDGNVHLVEEELLPFPKGNGPLGLHVTNTMDTSALKFSSAGASRTAAGPRSPPRGILSVGVGRSRRRRRPWPDRGSRTRSGPTGRRGPPPCGRCRPWTCG